MSREDFNSQTDPLIGTKFDKPLRDAIYSWITVNVKTACDEQRVLCAKTYAKKFGCDDSMADVLTIEQAPYPEGI